MSPQSWLRWRRYELVDALASLHSSNLGLRVYGLSSFWLPLIMSASAENSLTDLVREWPYAREFVLDTMDHDLIQRHGELLLSRSINIGRMVAFIGAGVAMSYGRISWRDLVRESLRIAEELYDTVEKEVADENPNEMSGFFKSEYPRINRIRETLHELKSQSDSASAWWEMTPARLLVLFQIADELGEAIHRFRHPNAVDLNPVRREVLELVYDDAGHARRLLKDAIANEGDRAWFFPERSLSRSELSKVQPPYQALFQLKALGKIIQLMPASMAPLKDLCRKYEDRVRGRIFVNPTHRFIVAAALSSLKANKAKQTLSVLRRSGQAANQAAGKRKGGFTRIRRETVEPDRDPLQLLVNRLGIRRFITTNYDLDIEQLIDDRGYRWRPSRQGENDTEFIVESVNAVEARARDFVFQEERAAHLIDFAVQDGRFALDVVHLHGRATRGDNILATEADYQRLYLKEESGHGHGRDLLDGAINVAFRGNALLFVGNGMGEDDLLRPLRHFMSEGPSGRESDAIALLPDIKGRQSRLEEKATLLRRYGVYAIHFGRGRLNPADEEEFLLSAIIKITRFLARRISERLKSPKKRPTGFANALRRSVAEEIEPNTGRAPLSDRILESKVDQTTRTRRMFLAKITEIELAKAALDIEQATINYLIDLCQRAESAPQLSLSSSLHRELKCGLIIAENLEDAILGGVLSATLHRLETERDKWRNEWFGNIRPRRADPRPQPWLLGRNPEAWKRGAARRLLAELEIDRRRTIRLPDDPQSRARAKDRFGVRTSQTLAQACSALREHVSSQPQDRHSPIFAPGRRVLPVGRPSRDREGTLLLGPYGGRGTSEIY